MSFEVTLKFLEAVKENNNTQWIHTYRDLFQQERKKFIDFIQKVLDEVIPMNDDRESWNEFRITPKDCVFRFNRDIRFTKDKSPYKEYFWAVIAQWGKKSQLPCLYIHIQPWNQSMISWGLYRPPTDIVHRVRKYIAKHLKQRNTIISKPEFKKVFKKIYGKDLTKIPRGYDAKSKAAERFLYKSRYIDHPLTDKEILSPHLIKKIVAYYKAMKPMNDFLNKI